MQHSINSTAESCRTTHTHINNTQPAGFASTPKNGGKSSKQIRPWAIGLSPKADMHWHSPFFPHVVKVLDATPG